MKNGPVKGQSLFPSLLEQTEYDFLRTDVHLGRHVILLGLAGSYSYGTENENSDIDIRGVTLNRKSDLIGLTTFEQYVDDHTDTTVYAFRKMITLLLNCNPNTLELLGLNEEHYLYLNDFGRELLNNTRLFLSKRAIQSFGAMRMHSSDGCRMHWRGLPIRRGKKNSIFLTQ